MKLNTILNTTGAVCAAIVAASVSLQKLDVIPPRWKIAVTTLGAIAGAVGAKDEDTRPS